MGFPRNYKPCAISNKFYHGCKTIVPIRRCRKRLSQVFTSCPKIPSVRNDRYDKYSPGAIWSGPVITMQQVNRLIRAALQVEETHVIFSNDMDQYNASHILIKYLWYRFIQMKGANELWFVGFVLMPRQNDWKMADFMDRAVNSSRLLHVKYLLVSQAFMAVQ